MGGIETAAGNGKPPLIRWSPANALMPWGENQDQRLWCQPGGLTCEMSQGHGSGKTLKKIYSSGTLKLGKSNTHDGRHSKTTGIQLGVCARVVFFFFFFWGGGLKSLFESLKNKMTVTRTTNPQRQYSSSIACPQVTKMWALAWFLLGAVRSLKTESPCSVHVTKDAT